MSKGGGQNSTIDPRAFPLLQGNYNMAESRANVPFTEYTKQLIASPSQATQSGQNTILGGAMGAGTGPLQAAVGGAQGLLGYAPPQVMAPSANATMGNATMGNAVSSNPALSAPYQNANIATAAAPGIPNAATANAAAINRGSIANVNPQTGLAGLSGYMNPYTNDVINASLNDLNRSRELGINQNASNATLSHAFDNSSRLGVQDAETNRGYADAASRMIAGLRNQGFDTASGLLQNDQSRNLQGQLANQGVDASIAGQNAGFGQQAGLFNAEAKNNMGQFGAQLLSQLGISNAGMLNQGGQFNAANTLANNQFNASNQQQTALSNAEAANQFGLANAGAANQFGLANAGAANQFDLANQATALQAGLANQNAGLQGAGLNLNASGLLGNLGGQEQNQFLTGANAIGGVGQAQDALSQANLGANYDQFMRMLQYPYQQQQLENSALGLIGSAGGTASYTAPRLSLLNAGKS